jgi:hypothetical protein
MTLIVNLLHCNFKKKLLNIFLESGLKKISDHFLFVTVKGNVNYIDERSISSSIPKSSSSNISKSIFSS